MPRYRWITVGAETRTLTDWAKQACLSPATLADRLARGLPMDRALATGLVDRVTAGRRGKVRSGWFIAGA